ncbi:MAG: hypothetical protein CMG07_04285 [Candidatus Marinimicrobia bacterium]|nr:hypothetical protein [Candidatus Neomarinimicrobiota bacterium]
MKNKKNLISVIIPTRYRLRLLKKAIKSVLTQSIKPNQIIIVDDACENKVERYISNLKRNYKNIDIKYIKRENYFEASSPASINLGYKNTTSKYIAILDDDDIWDKNYLKECLKNIKKSNAKLIISPLYHVKNKKIKIGKKIPNYFNLQDWFRFNPGLICSNIFISSKIFEKLKMLDSKLVYSADRDFMIRFCLSKFKFSILKRPMVYYRLSNQASKSKKFFRYFKSNLRFYIKYFFSMNFRSHLLNLIKLFRYLIKIILNFKNRKI